MGGGGGKKREKWRERRKLNEELLQYPERCSCLGRKIGISSLKVCSP